MMNDIFLYVFLPKSPVWHEFNLTLQWRETLALGRSRSQLSSQRHQPIWHSGFDILYCVWSPVH